MTICLSCDAKRSLFPPFLADALYFEPWESVLKAVQSKVAAGRITRFIHRVSPIRRIVVRFCCSRVLSIQDPPRFFRLQKRQSCQSYTQKRRGLAVGLRLAQANPEFTEGYPSRLTPRTLLSAVWTFLPA